MTHELGLRAVLHGLQRPLRVRRDRGRVAAGAVGLRVAQDLAIRALEQHLREDRLVLDAGGVVVLEQRVRGQVLVGELVVAEVEVHRGACGHEAVRALRRARRPAGPAAAAGRG
eukprot:SAG22_NODE_2350_length_2678_cov_4.230322_1_plen_113_part_10